MDLKLNHIMPDFNVTVSIWTQDVEGSSSACITFYAH